MVGLLWFSDVVQSRSPIVDTAGFNGIPVVLLFSGFASGVVAKTLVYAQVRCRPITPVPCKACLLDCESERAALLG